MLEKLKTLFGGLQKKEKKELPDLRRFLKEVEYWLDFFPAGGDTGRWLSKEKGSGLDFDELVSFLVYPVSQQIDYLATLRTLSPIPLVRIFQETGRINVIMLGDLSRSMVFGSDDPKTWILAKLAVLFNHTAYRFGDKFGFYGSDEKVISNLQFPPQRSKTYGLEIGLSLLNFRPSKNSARGIIDTLSFLPSKRSLILLASDFRLPADSIEEILGALTANHQVIALVLRDNIEETWPAKFLGLMNFGELEGSEKRTVLFSPKTAKSFGEASLKEEKELEKIFKKFDLLPVYLAAVDEKKITQDLERGRG